MFEAHKEQIISQLFDELDKNHEGKIGKNNINFDNLTANMIHLFEPIFEQIQSNGITLTKPQFIKHSLKLYE